MAHAAQSNVVGFSILRVFCTEHGKLWEYSVFLFKIRDCRTKKLGPAKKRIYQGIPLQGWLALVVRCVGVWWHRTTPTQTPVVEYLNVIWLLG